MNAARSLADTFRLAALFGRSGAGDGVCADGADAARKNRARSLPVGFYSLLTLVASIRRRREAGGELASAAQRAL